MTKPCPANIKVLITRFSAADVAYQVADAMLAARGGSHE